MEPSSVFSGTLPSLALALTDATGNLAARTAPHEPVAIATAVASVWTSRMRCCFSAPVSNVPDVCSIDRAEYDCVAFMVPR
jgi:hypothetical protein